MTEKPYDEDALLRLEKASSMTVKHRLMPLLYAFVKNVTRVDKMSIALTGHRPIRGQTAFIVGAGPSLDKNAHLLAECKKKGVVFTVNTALPTLKALGVKPDVLASVEAIDVSGHMDPDWCSVMAVDLQAHPHIVDAAIGRKGISYWFTNPGMHVLHLLRYLGTQPLYYRTSVTCAAMELAIQWGASRIVLLGMDLSYDLERGKCYAKDSAWDGYEISRKGEKLAFTGREDRDRIHHASGAPASPRERDDMLLPAWGDSPDSVHTTVEMFAQYKHFNDYTQFMRQEKINCTEGGAHIQGFQDLPLKRVLKKMPNRFGKIAWHDFRIPSEAISVVKEGLGEQSRCAKEIASKFLDKDSISAADIQIMAGGAIDYPIAMCQGDFMGISEAQELDVSQRLIAKYEVMNAAGDLLRRWLDEEIVIRPDIPFEHVTVIGEDNGLGENGDSNGTTDEIRNPGTGGGAVDNGSADIGRECSQGI